MDPNCSNGTQKRKSATKCNWRALSSLRTGIGRALRLVCQLRSAGSGARTSSLSIALICLSLTFSSTFLTGCRGGGRFLFFGLLSDGGILGWLILIVIWILLIALVIVLFVPGLKGGAAFGLTYLITGTALGLDSAVVISGIVGGIVFLSACGSKGAGESG